MGDTGTNRPTDPSSPRLLYVVPPRDTILAEDTHTHTHIRLIVPSSAQQLETEGEVDMICKTMEEIEK
jgi:hypothetical protein